MSGKCLTFEAKTKGLRNIPWIVQFFLFLNNKQVFYQIQQRFGIFFPHLKKTHHLILHKVNRVQYFFEKIPATWPFLFSSSNTFIVWAFSCLLTHCPYSCCDWGETLTCSGAGSFCLPGRQRVRSVCAGPPPTPPTGALSHSWPSSAPCWSQPSAHSACLACYPTQQWSPVESDQQTCKETIKVFKVLF